MKRCWNNHSEVCKAWASQEHKTGYAGNIKFEGPVILSYNWWPMALIDGYACLIRDERYSQSTCKHQLHVWRAAYKRYKLFHVIDIAVHEGNPEIAHQANVLHYVDKLRRMADEFWNSRSYAHTDQCIYLAVADEAKAYCERYNCSKFLPPLFGLELDGELAKSKVG